MTTKTATKTTTAPAVAPTDERKKIATNAARAVLKSLPEFTFQTGAKGRDLRQRIVIGGEVHYVTIQVVNKGAAKPAAKKVAAKPAKGK